MARKTKRVLVISDLHSGHLSGLTPPSWHDKPAGGAKRIKQAAFRQMAYSKYYHMVKALQPVDILLVNGDCIDGRGERSGGGELISGDIQHQCDMAAECIKLVKAKHVVMTYGTPYHTGKLEDWEDAIAREVKAEKIGGHEWIDVNGCIFDLKHKVGSSAVPHGRHTAIARENQWNINWASVRDEAPRANVIIRSHVHYFAFSGDAGWMGLTTPALQGPGSKYGTRQCSGIVNFGVVVFDVSPTGGYSWHAELAKMLSPKSMVLKL